MQVVALDGARFGGATPREPHRHDYHELIWVRDGRGRHLDRRRDGPGAAAHGDRDRPRPGPRVRGGGGPARRDRALPRGGLVGTAARRAPGWLLAGRGGRTVVGAAGRGAAARARGRGARGRAARPPDGQPRAAAPPALVVLLWIERWYDALAHRAPRGRRRRRGALPALLARCSSGTSRATTTPRTTPTRCRPARRALPRARAGHRPCDQGARHRARDARGRAAAAVHRPHRRRGRPARGFADPLYFSRAFKRHAARRRGPTATRARGKSMDA